MAQTNSGKKSWKCKHGCPQSKRPCKHLERKLPSLKQGSLSYDFRSLHSDTVMRAESTNSPLTDNLEKKLINYGLQGYEIELILDRFISNFSYRDLAKRQGWVDNRQASRILDDLVKRLSKSSSFKKLLQGGSK